MTASGARTTRTACSYCGVGCGISVETRTDQGTGMPVIARVSGGRITGVVASGNRGRGLHAAGRDLTVAGTRATDNGAAGVAVRGARVHDGGDNRTGRSGVLSKEFALIHTAAGLRSNAATAEEGNARIKHELSFHSLRHTSNSQLKMAGTSVGSGVVLTTVLFPSISGDGWGRG